MRNEEQREEYTYAVEADAFQSDFSHEFCSLYLVALGCGDFV